MIFKINKSSYYCATLLLKCALSTISKKQQTFFISKTVSKPDLSKVKGEDAYFSLPNHIGVFDGVGGWRDSGIDVSKFSEMLAESAKDYLNTHHSTGNTNLDLVKTLNSSLEVTKKNQITGSSTACLLSMNSIDGKSKLLNLGDSGAVFFRQKSHNDKNLHVLFETPPQCHSFNFPYQTGNIADKLKSQGEHGEFDSPAIANQYNLSLQRHDIALLATDGLFDNMFLDEITSSLQQNLNFHDLINDTTNLEDDSKMISQYEKQLDFAVNSLVSTALKLSLDKKYRSPFSVGYTASLMDKIKLHPNFKTSTPSEIEKTLKHYEYIGGKPDDITITLAMVITKNE